ncbi:MAG: nickel-dependent hydrogenase large subunit [bacterium]|nr:nickel-dependent hydrogenase large subunit [bacterium]
MAEMSVKTKEKKKIIIDPLTRIEGHLKIEVEVENGVVVDAHSTGTMFRGFEIILQGRDPRDAQHLTQRICGVCPASHAMAASKNLDNALGVTPPINGRIMRNLVLGANYLQSHILHFYHLAALDFVKGPDAAPFIPRYEGDYRLPEKVNAACVDHYLKALDIRKKCHEMLAIFGGKMPCHISFCPGGITESADSDKITNFMWRLKEIQAFINDVYIPDVIAVAETYPDYFSIGVGCKNLVSFGVFDLDQKDDKKLLHRGVYTDGKAASLDPDKITEYVKNSWFEDSTDGLNPKFGETKPAPRKKAGYSFLKSPRYDKKVHEAGPLSRMAVSYLTGESTVKKLVDGVLSHFKANITALFSVLGRHAARALECKFVADSMVDWLTQLKPEEPTCVPSSVPNRSTGIGLTEAPRGALGHWVSIENQKVARYQVITPTNWNASPRDSMGQMGPIEQALLGAPVKDPENPFSVIRVVRSFDPCLACSVHVMNTKKKLLAKYRVA